MLSLFFIASSACCFTTLRQFAWFQNLLWQKTLIYSLRCISCNTSIKHFRNFANGCRVTSIFQAKIIPNSSILRHFAYHSAAVCVIFEFTPVKNSVCELPMHFLQYIYQSFPEFCIWLQSGMLNPASTHP